MSTVDKKGLKISSTLFDFVNNEAIPGTNLKSDEFWKKFSSVVHELSPINRNLVEKREKIQKKIDTWHKSNNEKDFDKVFEQAYENLKRINFDGIYFRKDIGHQVRKNLTGN